MKKTQSGQALLILLLVMMIGLTVGLGVISRSVTDIRISRQEEESARVFSVAEAGIEESLKAGAATGVEIGTIKATVSETSLGGGGEFVFDKEIAAGDIQTVWLVGHNANGEPDPSVTPYIGNQIELYWGGTDTALEATLIYDDGSGYKLARYAIDPGGRGKFDSSGISGGGSLGGKSFTYKKTIDFPSGTKYALRLRLLYNTSAQLLGVKAVGGSIPPQGKCYESTASLGATGITRKVRQCTYHKAPPGIFDYVLYSEQDLSHQ